MISDSLGNTLHDKATRGIPLSETEQSELESWYARQDNLEEQALAPVAGITDSTTHLQAKIDEALDHLTTVTINIQKTITENKNLRSEIDQLRRQLIDSIPFKQAV